MELIVLALVLLVGWWLSVKLFPYRRCPRCKGTGNLGGGILGGVRPCGRCGSTGLLPRLGSGR
jgi:hypothetical protein